MRAVRRIRLPPTNRHVVRNPDHGSQPPYGGRPAVIRAALYVPGRTPIDAGPKSGSGTSAAYNRRDSSRATASTEVNHFVRSMQTRAPAQFGILRLAQLPPRISPAKCLILRHTRSCRSPAHKQKVLGRLRRSCIGGARGFARTRAGCEGYTTKRDTHSVWPLPPQFSTHLFF